LRRDRIPHGGENGQRIKVVRPKYPPKRRSDIFLFSVLLISLVIIAIWLFVGEGLIYIGLIGAIGVLAVILLIEARGLAEHVLLIDENGIELVVGPEERYSIRFGPDVETDVVPNPLSRYEDVEPIRGVIFKDDNTTIEWSRDEGWLVEEITRFLPTYARLVEGHKMRTGPNIDEHWEYLISLIEEVDQ
jgi:hypothetical protein